jgi:hypothetical protein
MSAFGGEADIRAIPQAVRIFHFSRSDGDGFDNTNCRIGRYNSL